jgi:superoxide dismutase
MAEVSYILFSRILVLLSTVTGHVNHSFFWKILAPTSSGGGKLPEGKLKTALENDFGSVEAFKKQFNAKTAAIQGSGWGWLVCTHLESNEQKLILNFPSYRDTIQAPKNWRSSPPRTKIPFLLVSTSFLNPSITMLSLSN